MDSSGSRRTPTPPRQDGGPGDRARLWLLQARWAFQTPLALARWLFGRVPLYRRNRSPGGEIHLPDEGRVLPGDPERLQRVADGVGPLYHRRYWIDVTDTRYGPEGLISAVCRQLDHVVPGELARFEGHGDDPDDVRLEVGNELVVRLPGPWDGPVRVIERTPTSFRLATLEGHVEAGEIDFRACRTERGFIRFEIESWARSGNTTVHFLYDRFGLAREMQTQMWAQLCNRVARLSGGVVMSNVQVQTDKQDAPKAPGGVGGPTGDGGAERRGRQPPNDDAPKAPGGVGGPTGDGGAERWGRSPRSTEVHTTARVSARARRTLDQLHDKGYNFDVDRRHELTPEHGWHVDDHCQALPPEPPGPPVPGGSWEVARGLLERYEFADPDIVRAVYYPDVPLADRNMVLEGRFYGLRFLLGLRVGGVNDLTDDEGGRSVRKWGWNYRTLQGHLEMGQMDYEIWKWLDTGDVEFRIHAVSKAAIIPNPVVRFGFRLFGRHMQQRFARRAKERMAELVTAELVAHATGAPADRPPVASVEQVPVEPASATPGVADHLDRQHD